MAALGTPSSGRSMNAMKGAFFDRSKVLRAVDRSTRKELNWFGGYARKVARNSLKPKRGISSPGSPPFVHQTYQQTHKTKKGQKVKLDKPKKRHSFRDSVLYAYQEKGSGFDGATTIIGPYLFNGARTSPTVPEVLEKGGVLTVKRGKFERAATYRPRPFMRPALDATIPKFMSRLKNSIR